MKIDKCFLLCVEMVLSLQVGDNWPLLGFTWWKLLNLKLLLGVRSLHDQGRYHLLQLLLAAVEFGRQGSADRPHVLSCSFVKGASL